MKIYTREIVVIGALFVIAGTIGYATLQQQDNETDALLTSSPASDMPTNQIVTSNEQTNNQEIMIDNTYTTATIQTNYGTITLDLYHDLMPITVGNFVTLAQDGFYDDTKFHRVIPGFMVQAGDPNSKTDDTSSYGTGGPGYTIEDEFVDDEKLSNTVGTVAMANTGQPNSGGSQFFINVADNINLDYDKQPLASKHPVFARVSQGMDVVRTIEELPTGQRDIPVNPVIIESITIE